MKDKPFLSDHPLFRGVTKLADIFGLSVLWLLFSLPLFTIGCASTALYDCTYHCIRGNEDGIYARFFRTFKANFKVATITTLIWLVLAAGLYYLDTVLFPVGTLGEGQISPLYVGFRFLILIPIAIFCWLFPLLSRYEFSVKSLNLTALKIAIACLPSSFMLALIAALSADACIKYLVPLIAVPCLCALLCSFFIERAFALCLPSGK